MPTSACLLLLGLLQLGCEEQTPTITKVQIQPSTPKSKLEWVAERLQHAFEMGQPSKLAGIRVEHTLSYQIKEPSEPTGDFQATLVIRTRTENTLLPKREGSELTSSTLNTASKTSKLDSIANQNQAVSFQDDNRFKLAVEDAVRGDTTSVGEQNPMSETRTVGVDTRSIESHSVQEQQSFELVYRNEQWQLAGEIDANPERLWFQYALQQ